MRQTEFFDPIELLAVEASRGSSVSAIGKTLRDGYSGTYLCTTAYKILLHHDCSHQTLFDEYGMQYNDVFFCGNFYIHGDSPIVTSKGVGIFFEECFIRSEVFGEPATIPKDQLERCQQIQAAAVILIKEFMLECRDGR